MNYIYRCNKCSDASHSGSVSTGIGKGWVRYPSKQRKKACPECLGPVVYVREENFQKWPDDSYIREGKLIGLTTKHAAKFTLLSAGSNVGKRSARTKIGSYNPKIDLGDGVDEEMEPDDPDDFDFFPEPEKPFNPAMRYTPDGDGKYVGRAFDISGCNPKCKMTRSKQVKGAKGRLNVTGAVMRQHYKPLVRLPKKMSSLSAYYWANLTCAPRGLAHSVNKKKSLEWCHLIADSLGGGTSPRNLVAASFAANTYMLAIEEQLQNKREFWLDIEAYCEDNHVAEFITYTITLAPNGKTKPGSAKTWVIDAREDHFTKADYERVGGEVSRHLKLA